MAASRLLDGVIAVNKPQWKTSQEMCQEFSKHFTRSQYFAPAINREALKRAKEPQSQRGRRSKHKRELKVKVGHGGTLDPLATGVLILGIESGTKAMEGFLRCTKVYETTVVFGAATDTYDRAGKVVVRRPYQHLSKEAVLEAMEGFRGKFVQQVPVYSACKMKGKPLYEYARQGEPLPRDLPTKEVHAMELELVDWLEPDTHKHYWPTVEVAAEEKKLLAPLWFPGEEANSQDEQMDDLSQEEKDEAEALAAHEAVKRKFDTDVDELVKDRPKSKRAKLGYPVGKDGPPMMSGALGGEDKANKQKQKRDKTPQRPNLVPQVDENAPPPWEDKGPPAARIRMTVSSGFYVRSFCHDLGLKLGCGALMAELVRVRVGDFSVGGPNCIEFEDLEKGEDTWAPKVEAMLSDWAAQRAAETKSTPQAAKSEPGAGAEAKSEKVLVAETGPYEPGKKNVEAMTETNGEDGGKKEGLTPPTSRFTSKSAASGEKTDDDEKSWNGIQD